MFQRSGENAKIGAWAPWSRLAVIAITNGIFFAMADVGSTLTSIIKKENVSREILSQPNYFVLLAALLSAVLFAVLWERIGAARFGPAIALGGFLAGLFVALYCFSAAKASASMPPLVLNIGWSILLSLTVGAPDILALPGSLAKRTTS